MYLTISVCNTISQMVTSKVFDFKKVYHDYQVKDCVCLCSIFNKLSKHILNVTGYCLTNFLTYPEVAYEYIISTVPAGLVKIASFRSVDSWLLKSIQGGKYFPQKGCFYSSYRKKILSLLAKLKILQRRVESYRQGTVSLLRVIEREQCHSRLSSSNLCFFIKIAQITLMT